MSEFLGSTHFILSTFSFLLANFQPLNKYTYIDLFLTYLLTSNRMVSIFIEITVTFCQNNLHFCTNTITNCQCFLQEYILIISMLLNKNKYACNVYIYNIYNQTENLPKKIKLLRHISVQPYQLITMEYVNICQCLLLIVNVYIQIIRNQIKRANFEATLSTIKTIRFVKQLSIIKR